MKILIPLLVVALGFVSPIASAQESAYYIGLGLGKSSIDLNSDDFGTQIGTAVRSAVTTDTAFKILGGYTFNRNWALEVGYTDLGQFRYQVTPTQGAYTGNRYSFDYKATSWSMGARGRIPIVSQFSVFGTIGVTINKANDTFSLDDRNHIVAPLAPGATPGVYANSAVFSNKGSHSRTRSELLVGVGGEYSVSRNLTVRFEYEDLGQFGNQDNTGRGGLAIWSLGVVYMF